MRNLLISLCVCLLVVAASCAPTQASITFTATNGSNLTAAAVFTDLGAGMLQVTLSNTSASDVLVPADILTALFFDAPTALTPISATLSAGSTVFFGPTGSGNVGGEWAYGSSLSGAPFGATRGISSAGFGLFGDANFSGANLQGPTAVDGLQYGITSAGDNTASGNAAVTGGNALIKSSVDFKLGYEGTLDLSQVSNVSFQYGTSLTEPNIQIPEAASIAIWSLLIGSVALIASRFGGRK